MVDVICVLKAFLKCPPKTQNFPLNRFRGIFSVVMIWNSSRSRCKVEVVLCNMRKNCRQPLRFPCIVSAFFCKMENLCSQTLLPLWRFSLNVTTAGRWMREKRHFKSSVFSVAYTKKTRKLKNVKKWFGLLFTSELFFKKDVVCTKKKMSM